MNWTDFEKLEFKIGDSLWVLDEKGEGHWGIYKGQYNQSDRTFLFTNSGNGKDETVSIDKMQRITK